MGQALMGWALRGRAFMGRALMGFPGPLWASLGPHGPGPYGPHWALMGRALMGLPGLLWADPLVSPLALMGQTLMGPLG